MKETQMMTDQKWIIFLLLHFVRLFSADSEFIDYPSVNQSSSWQNNPNSERGTWIFNDGSQVRPILSLANNGYPSFGFGFLKNRNANTFNLVLFKIPIRNLPNSSFTNFDLPPIVLWSAITNNPIEEDATLHLLVTQGLVLRDADDKRVWFTKISGSNVAGMSLNGEGNLKLVDSSNHVVWQSFDEPTNTWLPGQRLKYNQRLISRVSSSDFSQGLFFLRVDQDNVKGFVSSIPPQSYSAIYPYHSNYSVLNFEIGFLNHSNNSVIYQTEEQGFQYMRLEPNGHLNVYQLLNGDTEAVYRDLLIDTRYGNCTYPTVCGRYGTCAMESCSCPGETSGTPSYFKKLNATQTSSGCERVTPLSCQNPLLHTFLELKGVTYFRFLPNFINVSADDCKRVCLNNCSCEAVFFRYRDDILSGNCSLQPNLFSMKEVAADITVDAFIKVQHEEGNRSNSSNVSKKKEHTIIIVVCIVASVSFLCFLAVVYCFTRRKKISGKEQACDQSIDQSLVNLPNVLRTFSYENLRSATHDFQHKLGRGGFGSVYKGKLDDGTVVAVKRLELDVRHGKTQFLAEVETIGSLHHLNLVRLVGYCAEKSNWFLVYEHMYNGSLDKWIFRQNQSQALKWEIRRNIILGIAKGLEYLHELCNKNIFHFDIKPENILLDENFNVKISDFGLARLIDKDETHVSTGVKGTRGYMAPELILNQNITVKIDVYSFGVVILETICGRRNSSLSQDVRLLDLVKIKAEEDKLFDLVDQGNEDMKQFEEDVVNIMRIAISCLHSNIKKRPSASNVVKMLEGLIDLEPTMSYGFLSLSHDDEEIIHIDQSESNPSLPLPSILSAAR